MIDTTLHLTSERTRFCDVDGEPVPYLEWEVRGLVSEREFLPIFERPGKAPVTVIDDAGRSVLRLEKPRRVILPMFRYDPATGLVEGEGEPCTLEDRMAAVIRASREGEPYNIHREDIRKVEKYVHIRLLLAGYEGHMMGCLPGFDEFPFYFMVRANLVRS